VLQCVTVCCSVLQCVAVCCSVLQCVAVCCSVLQCVAVCCSVLQALDECRMSREGLPVIAISLRDRLSKSLLLTQPPLSYDAYLSKPTNTGKPPLDIRHSQFNRVIDRQSRCTVKVKTYLPHRREKWGKKISWYNKKEFFGSSFFVDFKNDQGLDHPLTFATRGIAGKCCLTQLWVYGLKEACAVSK